MNDFPPGSVWLVGSGPGDPELLTRKAERLLLSADVVFYDALVGKGILKLIPNSTPLYSVGKRSGRHSVAQPMICDLLVKAALEGKRVVRLKGGDPSIFGRANEEIEACRASSIEVRICAGVTTASAAAAQLGRSLTTRGLARRLTFVTAHTSKGVAPDLDWAAMADPQTTIAVYMGKAAARHISNGLISAGLDRATPVVLIENVSLSNCQQFHTRLDMLPLAAKTSLGDGPALILIGEAMRDPAECEMYSADSSKRAREVSG